MEKYTSTLRLRMSAKDAHYGGNLVDGAHMVHLFGGKAVGHLKCPNMVKTTHVQKFVHNRNSASQ